MKQENSKNKLTKNSRGSVIKSAKGTKNNLLIRSKTEAKGITLIALVITIIVLLILAGVAITTLLGDNGIITNATKAKTVTERKSMQENIQLAVLSAMSNTNHDLTLENLEREVKSQLGSDVLVEQDGIGGYVIGKDKNANNHLTNVYGVVDKEGKVGDGKWHFVKLTEEEANDKEVKISDGKTTLIVGKKIDYSPTKKENNENLTEGELQDEKYKCEVSDLADDIGSYGGTYTYKADGYEGEWGVLGAESGKILIAPQENSVAPLSTTNLGTESSTKNLAIHGKKGYQYGIKALNDISKIYGYGKGAESARSITEEDINKITGYDPRNVDGNPSNYGEINEYGNQVTYKYKTENSTDWRYYNKKEGKEKTGTYNHPFEYLNGSNWHKLTEGEQATLTCTYYGYLGTSTNKITSDVLAYKMLYGETNENGELNKQWIYWLGSTYINTDQAVGFGMKYVHGNGMSCCYLSRFISEFARSEIVAFVP